MSPSLSRRLIAVLLASGSCQVALPLISGQPLIPAAVAQAKRPSVAGIWLGELTVGPQKLRLVLHLEQTDNGQWQATLDSPDQNAMGLPLNRVALTPDTLSFAHDGSGMAFSGRISENGLQVVGEFKQGAAKLPLTLNKTDKAPTVARKPQEPLPPFPYGSQDVRFENAKAKIGLAGTLTLPKAAGPHPAVILINGSGQQDRDCTLFGHKPFLLLADTLTRRGFAVLRCDDRGIGGSGGDPAVSTTADFADDIDAALAYLQTRPEIDAKRISLIGHSEGGLIGTMVAARNPAVAALVLLAGPGLPGDDIVISQGRALMKAAGASPAESDASTKMQRDLFAIVKQEDDPAMRRAKLSALLHAVMAKEGRSEDPKAAAAVEGQLRALTSPWYRHFLTFDPRPELARVRVPVLALNGESDMQVAAKDNLEAIAKAVRSNGNADVTTTALPQLNHLFQTAKTGLPSEYGQLDETMAPAVLQTIGDWLAKHAGTTVN
jgi:pimeloyl-ACP methyl ester carboxylesterase